MLLRSPVNVVWKRPSTRGRVVRITFTLDPLKTMHGMQTMCGHA
jgi:hypothetical protein